MIPQNNNETPPLNIDVKDELSKDVTIHKNISQEIIITTADKIKLVLMKTKKELTAQRNWLAPASLLISLTLTLCTADFKDVFSMSKDYWRALFTFIFIAAAIWLVITLIQLYKNRKRADLNNIVEQIKLKEEN